MATLTTHLWKIKLQPPDFAWVAQAKFVRAIFRIGGSPGSGLLQLLEHQGRGVGDAACTQG